MIGSVPSTWPRALRGAALVACLLGPVAGARAQEATPAELAELVAGTAAGSDAELALRAKEFARAPGAVDAYLAYAASTETGALGLAERSRLDQVASFLPVDQICGDVRRALGDPREPAWRLAALELLASRAGADSVNLVVDVVADSGEAELSGPLASGLRSALVELSRRDPRFFEELGELTLVRIEVAAEIVRAFGATRDPGGVDWLGRQLRDAELCGPALIELRHMAELVPPARAVTLSEQVRPFLGSESSNERRAAMTVLARLGDPTCVPRLLELLEQGDSGERRDAHEALCTLSGRDFPAQPTSWRGWYERENTWWEEQAEGTFERLGSEDPSEVLSAVRALSERGLRRDRVAAELAELVRRHELPTLRAQACAALGRLRARSATEVLLQALEDDDQGVRTQAHAALRAITGESLPADPDAWGDLLGA